MVTSIREKMSITINDELRAYIDPLTADELAALERSLLTEGCRDALVLWGDVLVDGHNRYAICQKHGIEFQTVQNTRFTSMDDVHLWMIDNHLGRRSVSDFQRGVLALRKKDIVMARTRPAAAPVAVGDAAPLSEAPAVPAAALTTREALARAARVSSNTIGQIEKIQREAAPELVDAVKAGTISINAAAAVASLPVERQVAAVAGGKKELQQAAREVREAKAAAKPAPTASVEEADAVVAGDEAEALSDDVFTLRAAVARLNGKVAELNEEAAALRRQINTLTADLEEARRG